MPRLSLRFLLPEDPQESLKEWITFRCKLWGKVDQFWVQFNNWSLAEACEALCISRYELKMLLDSGLLPIIQKPDGLNRDWLINKAGVIKFIDKLAQSARGAAEVTNSYSLKGILRQGFSISELISAMQQNELSYSFSSNPQKPQSILQFHSFSAESH